MQRLRTFLILIGGIIAAEAAVQRYFDDNDRTYFKKLFLAEENREDAKDIYFATAGLRILDTPPIRPDDLCQSLQDYMDETSLESISYTVRATAFFKNCKITLTPAGTEVLKSALVKGSTIKDLYFAIAAFNALKLSFELSEVLEAVEFAIRRDSGSIETNTLAMHIAAELGSDTLIKTMEVVIPGLLKKAIVFEGGVWAFDYDVIVTSNAINAIFRIIEITKNPDVIPFKAVEGFAQFVLYTKNAVSSVEASSRILQCLTRLLNYAGSKPIAITRFGPPTISLQSPVLKVKVVDLAGLAVSAQPVEVKVTAILHDDEDVLASLAALPQFERAKFDPTLYEANMANAKLNAGFYTVRIEAMNQSADVDIKIMAGKLEFIDAVIGTTDDEETASAERLHSTKLTFPELSKYPVSLELHERLVLKFKLRDGLSGQFLVVHQAFVVFRNEKHPERELALNAKYEEPTQMYRLGVSAKRHGKLFEFMSGNYEIEIIVGDAVVDRTVVWKCARAELKFPTPRGWSLAEIPDSRTVFRPKPIIRHVFRSKEKRPPTTVSQFFTGLVILPLVCVILYWLVIGVNLYNMPLSLATPVFHASIASIFVSYYFFWIRINMFATLKFVIPLSAIAFISGSHMLDLLQRKARPST